MLIFATSDKGGTGRSVTSCNMGYRRAMAGSDVCYVDFDFGSPTAGAILQISAVERGAADRGLHSYLRGRAAEPRPVDVWQESERSSLRSRPPGAGRFTLLPGDVGGGEFPSTPEVVERCATLLSRLDEEFDLCLVDLSAGRSHATEMVLAATALPELSQLVHRWLVFHRWTSQHIAAAAALAYGDRGIVEAGVARGHDRDSLRRAIRFVRTVMLQPNAPELSGLRAAQVAWLQDSNQQLQRLARERRIGRTVVLGTVPLDPVLQWQEQLITDDDVMERQIANKETVEAFTHLAQRLTDDEAWAGL